MRTRTSHAPDGWRDEGPGAPQSVGFSGSLVVGLSGREMSPEQRAEYARRRRARQREKHNAQMRDARPKAPVDRTPVWYREAPRCLAWMPRVGAHCARHAGHSDSHRSPVAMAADAARRAA